jgi:hypothetical protein
MRQNTFNYCREKFKNAFDLNKLLLNCVCLNTLVPEKRVEKAYLHYIVTNYL